MRKLGIIAGGITALIILGMLSTAATGGYLMGKLGNLNASPEKALALIAEGVIFSFTIVMALWSINQLFTFALFAGAAVAIVYFMGKNAGVNVSINDSPGASVIAVGRGATLQITQTWVSMDLETLKQMGFVPSGKKAEIGGRKTQLLGNPDAPDRVAAYDPKRKEAAFLPKRQT